MSTAATAAAPRRSRSSSRRSSSRSRRRSSSRSPRSVHLVHYSSRPLEVWGKIPKYDKYSNHLTMSQHRTAFNTGKPKGIWYAYEKDWLTHYGAQIKDRKNISEKNKKDAFGCKYVFEVPKSVFTKDVTPDPSKILVLSLSNFKDFLITYNAPGVFPDRYVLRGKKPQPMDDWMNVWHGLPKDYTFDKKPYIGVDQYFAGVEFSQDLVEFKPENGFKTITAENKMGNPKIVYEFDLTSGDGTSRHVAADVSFLRYLEVRSGCFFSPQTLFSNPPPHYLDKSASADTCVSGAAAAASAAAGATTGSAAAGTARRTRRMRRH